MSKDTTDKIKKQAKGRKMIFAMQLIPKYISKMKKVNCKKKKKQRK